MTDRSGASDFEKTVLRKLKRLEEFMDRAQLGGSGTNTGFAIQYATLDTTNPPTATELAAAFGSPSAVGANFIGLINDAGGGTSEYLVMSDGASFWYQALTKPIIGPPLPPQPAANADLTYIFANGVLGRARNFITGGLSVVYADATGTSTGTGPGVDFVLDPPGQKNAAYRAYGDVVEYTSDLDTTVPTWTPVLTIAAVQSATGFSGLSFVKLANSKIETGLIYVSWHGASGTAGVGRSVSHDNGATWNHAQVYNLGNNNFRMIADPAIAGKLWWAGDLPSHGTFGYSLDYGATWTVLSTSFNYIVDLAIDSTDATHIVYRLEDKLYYSQDNGGSFLSYTLSGHGFNSGCYKLDISAEDADDVLWVESSTPYHSTDGGAGYSIGTGMSGSSCEGGGGPAVLAVSRWPYDKNQVFWLWCPAGVSPNPNQIAYSPNLMATVQNKLGNWNAVMGTFANPVMIASVSLV